MTITVRKICLAALLAPSLSPLPRYWAQIIAAPVASAANTWMTNILMESTNDTADIATLPTLLTIIVSAIPIREFNICSTIIGINSIHRFFVENIRLSQSIFDASYNLFFREFMFILCLHYFYLVFFHGIHRSHSVFNRYPPENFHGYCNHPASETQDRNRKRIHYAKTKDGETPSFILS